MNIHIALSSKPICQVTELIVRANGHAITEFAPASLVITDNSILILDALHAGKDVAQFAPKGKATLTQLVPEDCVERIKVFAPTEHSIEWLDRFATFLTEL